MKHGIILVQVELGGSFFIMLLGKSSTHWTLPHAFLTVCLSASLSSRNSRCLPNFQTEKNQKNPISTPYNTSYYAFSNNAQNTYLHFRPQFSLLHIPGSSPPSPQDHRQNHYPTRPHKNQHNRIRLQQQQQHFIKERVFEFSPSEA